MPFRVKVMKICYVLVLYYIPIMLSKVIIIKITGDIIIPRFRKNVRQTATAFFSPCMRQGLPFVKYFNKKSNNTYTQANYDTKSKCVHKTLHFEYFIS